MSCVSRCAAAASAGMSSGGCCRSPSMTRAHGDAPADNPSTMAPDRPPTRSPSSRWMSRMGSADCSADFRMYTGVSSLESSTKISSLISAATATRSIRRTSSDTLPASLKVGTTTDIPLSTSGNSPLCIGDSTCSCMRRPPLRGFFWADLNQDLVSQSADTLHHFRQVIAHLALQYGPDPSPGTCFDSMTDRTPIE
jgi:hypothetical protein